MAYFITWNVCFHRQHKAYITWIDFRDIANIMMTSRIKTFSALLALCEGISLTKTSDAELYLLRCAPEQTTEKFGSHVIWLQCCPIALKFDRRGNTAEATVKFQSNTIIRTPNFTGSRITAELTGAWMPPGIHVSLIWGLSSITNLGKHIHIFAVLLPMLSRRYMSVGFLLEQGQVHTSMGDVILCLSINFVLNVAIFDIY